MEIDLDIASKSSVAIRVTEQKEIDVGRSTMENFIQGIESGISVRVRDVNSKRDLSSVEYNFDFVIETGDVTTLKGAELSAPEGSPGLPMSAVSLFLNSVNSVYESGESMAEIRQEIAEEKKGKDEHELKKEEAENLEEVLNIDTTLGDIDGIVFASLDTFADIERPRFSPELAFKPTVGGGNVVKEFRAIDDVLHSFGYETTLVQGSQQLSIDDTEEITYRGFISMIDEMQHELDGLPLNIMLSSAVKKDFDLMNTQ